MDWTEERDRLIADTLRFVKEVAGEEPGLAAKLHAAVSVEIANAADPRQIVPPRTKPLDIADLREDIRTRVGAFKARQQAMQDEREAYFRRTIDEARASLRS